MQLLICLAGPFIGYTQTLQIIKPAAGWQREGILLSLKDQLQHPDLSWPVSLLRYRLEFGDQGPLKGQYKVVEAGSGKTVSYQLADIEEGNGRIRSATLYLLTDLPSGAERSFRFLAGKPEQAVMEQPVKRTPGKGQVQLSNGLIRICLPDGSGKTRPPILQYGNAGQWLGEGLSSPAFSKASMKVQLLEEGPLTTAYRISYHFPGNKQYQVVVRLTAAMEFAELEESMQGFTEKDGLSWQIRWTGIQPNTRYAPVRTGLARPTGDKSPDRNYYGEFLREPMEGLLADSLLNDKHPTQRNDQQNGPDGLLPFRLALYDNWMSWWRLPTAAFWQESGDATTVGIFIKEAERWNDGQYLIWGSKERGSILYHWKDGVLDYTFPLAGASRSTGIAAYPHSRDIRQMNASKKPLAYIDQLRRYYGWIPLDKTKDWILDYAASDGAFPKYFKPANAQDKLNRGWLEQSLKAALTGIGTGSERNYGPSPVGSRIFYESIVPAFDINRNAMPAEQYRRLRAWLLFISYVYMDEGLMPVRNLLSGHPNFLMDVKTVPGLCAFLFPGHPQAGMMADHFEKSIQLNYRYHIRPELPLWETRAGRWTENLATYTWAALRPTVRTNFLLRHFYDGQNRVLQPGVSDLGGWLLNTLTPPMDYANGRRTYPPQGAHAHPSDGPPDNLRLLAYDLQQYDPLLAEHLLWATDTTDKPFEGDREKTAVWQEVLNTGTAANNKGTAPSLVSAKYTGYGIVLRSQFGQSDEMQVILQQIDEGPNYRWGRAAKGGNGVIYYNAAGKRYSFNGPEDAGDGPFGDVERVTNFGVKKEPGYRELGPYRSVGRGDLTAPLYDFGFAQSATIYGEASIVDRYHSRNVVQVGNEYIVIYDDVADATVPGRFSWFVAREDNFPFIQQILPNVQPVDADIRSSQSGYHKDPAVLPTKGRYYDGKGDFLTLVSHHVLDVERIPAGAKVMLDNGGVDYIFRSDKPVVFRQDDLAFEGSSGIIRRQAGDGICAALFLGRTIAAAGLRIAVDSANTGISFTTTSTGYSGQCKTAVAQTIRFYLTNPAPGFFYVNGSLVQLKRAADGAYLVSFEKGDNNWQWSNRGVVPAQPVITGYTARNGGAALEWTPVAGADSYTVEASRDNGRTWEKLQQVSVTSALLSGLTNGQKLHVRVMATGSGGFGLPSALYPVYITADAPVRPEGLLVICQGDAAAISWGQLLGAAQYKLYRRVQQAADSSWKLLYTGSRRDYVDQLQPGISYEYSVTAINDNGESPRSHIRNADRTSFLQWYPVPHSGFIRDTEDHENGFPEFNPFIEDKRPILPYPGQH